MLIELIWWVRAWLTHSHHWQKPVQCTWARESAHSTQEEGKLVHIELAHLACLLTVRKSISDVPLYYCCYCLFQMFRTFFKFVCLFFFLSWHTLLWFQVCTIVIQRFFYVLLCSPQGWRPSVTIQHGSGTLDPIPDAAPFVPMTYSFQNWMPVPPSPLHPCCSSVSSLHLWPRPACSLYLRVSFVHFCLETFYFKKKHSGEMELSGEFLNADWRKIKIRDTQGFVFS